MAFDVRNLSEMRALGSNRWAWHYFTTDSLATVLAPDYFSTVNGLARFHVGDLLIVVASSGAESEIATIGSLAGGSVVVLAPTVSAAAVVRADGVTAQQAFDALAAGGAPVTAASVSFSPTGNVASSSVQAAVAELDLEKADAAATTAALALKQDKTPTASIDANGQRIINLATPTLSTDAVTKAYADALAQGLSAKSAVVAATTANITLSGAQTIDGVSVVAGNRVLVKNQTTASQNGIYVASSGAWSRATDMDAWGETQGAYTLVTGGSTQANTGWVSQTAAGGTLDTTSITFAQFTAASNVTFNGRAGPTISPASGDYTDLLVTSALVPTNYTRGADGATVKGHLEGIDSKLGALGTGGQSSIMATGSAGGAPATSLTASQAQIGAAVTITPKSTGSTILLVARLDLTKDANTTKRTVTSRLWRGAVSSGVQVGQDSVVTSAANAEGFVSIIVGIDAPATTSATTYRLSAAGDVNATVTAARYELRAVELLVGGYDQTTPFDTTNGVTGAVARSTQAALGDALSVKGFGATLDSAPFVAAAASGKKRFLVPAGSYVFGATTVTVPDDCEFFGENDNVVISTTSSTGAFQLGNRSVLRGLKITSGGSGTPRGVTFTSAAVVGAKVLDCSLTNMSAGVYVGATSSSNGHTDLTIRGNYFANNSYAIEAIRLVKSEISGNRMYQTTAVQRNIEINGGYGNRIFGNHINGGITGIIFLVDYSLMGGVYTYGNNIYGNRVIGCSEESISFDCNGDVHSQCAAREYDTVSAHSGATITLSGAGWSSAGGSNVGDYLYFLTGALAGRLYPITAQTNAVFTLGIDTSNESSLIANGDAVIIGAHMFGNAITANTIELPSGYPDAKGIVLWGNCYDNAIAGNTITHLDRTTGALGTAPGRNGIVLASLNGLDATGSLVSSAGVRAPCDRNLVAGNTLENCRLWLGYKNYGATADYAIVGNDARNNVEPIGHPLFIDSTVQPQARSVAFTLRRAHDQRQEGWSGTWTATIPSAATLGEGFSYTFVSTSGTQTVAGNLASPTVSSTAGTIFVANGKVYLMAGGTLTTLW